jgi:NADH-quinone oxidoreductase subunit M
MIGEFFILRGVVETFGVSMGSLVVILAMILMFILSVWYGFYTIRKVFYGKPKDTTRKEISRYLYVPLYIIGLVSVMLVFPPWSTALIPGIKAVILGGLLP